MSVSKPLTDPVCGMKVTDRAAHFLSHRGLRIYFCSAGCKAKFAANRADYLIGATMNTKGALVMRAERVGSQTVLAGIVQMVAQAQRSKAPMQRMADQVAGFFVVAGVSIAVLTLLAWGLFGPQPSWVYGLINAVAVLIVACPCALAMSLSSVSVISNALRLRRVTA
jgi:cation transport ATPase